MPHLLLSPEIQCFPTWVVSDGLHENVDPADFPLSAGVVAALDEWRSRWDAIYDLNDPASAAFGSLQEEHRFWEDGRTLQRRLQGELGSEWTVSLRERS